MRNIRKTVCPKCNFEISNVSFKKHFEKCDGLGPRKMRPKKRGTEASKKKMSEASRKNWENLKYRESVSSSLKGRVPGIASSLEKEFERKRKISETCSKNKKTGGLRHGSGRGKKGWYKGYWCDSSWELAYVIYCLEHEIKLIRNTEKFEYTWENETHYYIPDFILDDGSYVEIKGYRTTQVEEKTKQFTRQLEVIDKNTIGKYVDYTVSKYGKDFTSLYEIGSVS